MVEDQEERKKGAERYRRLPTGTHGLHPDEVERDQRARLQMAMIELVAARGYEAVRIVDLTKLARVSRPTFYGLYTDKEALLGAVYDQIADRAVGMVQQAFADGTLPQRIQATTRVFTKLAAAEPEVMSLFVLGALGAGARALRRRNLMLEAFEETIRAGREHASPAEPGAVEGDLTVKMLVGGIREVTAARLRTDRASELPRLADELAAWANSYPVALPAELALRASKSRAAPEDAAVSSQRARSSPDRLPSGRHDLPRDLVVKNQRERIVDATAEIVTIKGLSALTIPEIARRANALPTRFSMSCMRASTRRSWAPRRSGCTWRCRSPPGV